MSYIVLKKGAQGTWETLGFRSREMPREDAQRVQYDLANKYQYNEYAIAKIESVSSVEKQVVSRSVSPETGERDLREAS